MRNVPQLPRGEFVRRVTEALDTLTASYLAALQNDSVTPRLSVAHFMKSFSISRSSLYQDHPYLLENIKESFASLQRQAEEKRREKKPSVASLTAEVIRLKAELKKQSCRSASLQMRQIIEQLGPALRDRTRLVQEQQEHIRTIEALHRQIANQTGLIASVMSSQEEEY